MTDLLTICMYTGIAFYISITIATVIWSFRRIRDKFLAKLTTEQKKRYRGFKIGATKRKESS